MNCCFKILSFGVCYGTEDDQNSKKQSQIFFFFLLLTQLPFSIFHFNSVSYKILSKQGVIRMVCKERGHYTHQKKNILNILYFKV